MKIQQLIRFYLACIEAEDRQALCKKLTALHHSVLSPWDDKEALFTRGEACVEFETKDDREQRLLSGRVAVAGEAERFYYGYPLLLFRDRREWNVSPLFMQEVAVQPLGASRFRVQASDADGIEANLLLFQRQHVPPEELRGIARDLEDHFDSFDARLAAAFQAMAVPWRGFPPETLDPWPADQLIDGSWINRPILFTSERGPYTVHLRRELEKLAGDPEIPDKIRRTALGAFFHNRSGEAEVARDPIALLPVMPMNTGQERAARSALRAPLTVVTGPPGTGKSQVVVDLLASCALAGKPVLFVSKNNKAVDVVRERLRQLLGDQQDWVLRLGNSETIRKCREEMHGRLAAVGVIAPEQPPSAHLVHQVDEAISTVRRRIRDLAQAQSELAALERDSRSLESLVEEAWVDAGNDWTGDLGAFAAAKKARRQAEELASGSRRSLRLWLGRTVFRRRTIRRLRAGVDAASRDLPEQIRADLRRPLETDSGSFSPLAEAFGRICAFGQWREAVRARDHKLGELEAEQPAKRLVCELEELQGRRSELAVAQFRTGWTRRVRASLVHYRLTRYFDLLDRAARLRWENLPPALLEQWASQLRSLGPDLPVWIVTNLSARRALPLRPGLFDLLIIDEASQCDIPSALPLLFRTRRALIIGDPQQLRHISTLRTSDEEELAAQHGLADEVSRWSYNQRSLYNLAEQVAAARGQPLGFLAEHYRSHPDIVEFSNRTFYSGRLVLRTGIEALRGRLGDMPLGVFWHNTPGRVPPSSRSAWNQAEVEAAVGLLDQWHDAGLLQDARISVGVVTPFRLQMDKIKERLERRPWHASVAGKVVVGTAHRFQGDECDIMVFSPVVSDGMLPRLVRWVADTDQLLNVAVTRARGALHVVGDMSACLEAGGSLAEFAAFVQAGLAAGAPGEQTESPAEQAVADMLCELGLWHKSQYPLGRYRLDFLVVSPTGTRYDVEVDGRGHLTDEAVRSDAARDGFVTGQGIKVLRVDARSVFRRPEQVKTALSRLC
jgi:very-short-patch-repair endonuclease